MEILQNLEKYLEFIYISAADVIVFKWKPPQSYKSFLLDMNIVKENPMESVFFHMDKGNRKIAYIRKGLLIYAIGAENNVQFQILESLLEEIDKKFHEIYDPEVILSYDNVSTSMFKGFKVDVDELIKDFSNSGAIKKVDVQCRVCGKLLPLFIKKSFVDNADSYPVSIVYSHKGHAILCFIDKNYGVRGVELVSITS